MVGPQTEKPLLIALFTHSCHFNFQWLLSMYIYAKNILAKLPNFIPIQSETMEL